MDHVKVCNKDISFLSVDVMNNLIFFLKKKIAVGFCPEGVIDNANYTQTEVGQTGSGVCQLGWTGTPTIECTNVDDVPTWSETINDPCQG